MISKLPILLLLVTSTHLAGQFNFAAGLQQEHQKKLEQLNPAERLTFGPEDNFQSTRSKGRNEILFTEKTHLNPKIMKLDLKKRTKSDFELQLIGAEQIQYSPDETKILYRRISNKADGEICWQNRNEAKPNCYSALVGEKQFPFWLGNSRIGYVLKNRIENKTEIHSMALDGSADSTLSSEGLVHPQGHPKGSHIIAVDKNSQELVNKNNSGADCRNQLKWPGAIAFPSFSRDGEKVVLSWYPSDTNSDGRIDVNDRSVVIRVNTADLCSKESLMPQVLTSLDQDCGHARQGQHLDMTCAFEGSLDIYQLPLSGIIPESWGQRELLRAHSAARTPEERLLSLWGMALKSTPTIDHFNARVWSQFLIMRDDVSSLAWLKVATSDLSLKKDQLLLWETMLIAGILRKSEPSGDITISLKANLEEHQRKVQKNSLSPLRRLAEARISRLIGGSAETSKAKAEILKVADAKMDSFFEVLMTSLEWENLNQHTSLPEPNFMRFLASNLPQHSAQVLPLWVRSLERLENHSTDQRKSAIQSALSRIQKESLVQKLLQMEMLSIEVAASEKSHGGTPSYLAFDREFTKLRSTPELARFVAYRAIRLWTKADHLKEVQFIASNLMKFIESPSLEYTRAREYFIASSSDRAYEMELGKQPVPAFGHFYGAITFTDDLESHWGMQRNLVSANRGNQLKMQIDEMVRLKFTDSLEPRLRLMAELSQVKSLNESDLSQFIAKFERISTGDDQPISLLIESSLRLERLMLRSWQTGSENLEESEKIHRSLTLALDGARDNQRLTAAVLNNMALLYSHTQQWGTAERAWSQRLKYPFNDKGERAITRWFRAQALFHLGDSQLALKTLSETPQEDIPKEWRFPYFHRQALYATMARQNEIALKATQTALTNSDSKENTLAVEFLAARALWALGRNVEAKERFSSLISKIESLPKKTLEARPTGAHPRRTMILTTGYMLQLSTSKDEILKWGKLRLEALGKSLDDAKSLGIPSDAFLEARLKAQLRLLEVSSSSDAATVAEFLKDLDAFRQEAGQIASIPWFEGLSALMILEFSGIVPLTPAQKADINQRVESFLASAGKLPYPSPLLTSQTLRLRASQLAFNKSGPWAREDRVHYDRLLNSELLKKLRAESPALSQKSEDWINAFKEKILR